MNYRSVLTHYHGDFSLRGNHNPHVMWLFTHEHRQIASAIFFNFLALNCSAPTLRRGKMEFLWDRPIEEWFGSS
jgi:hypothetical protein